MYFFVKTCFVLLLLLLLFSFDSDYFCCVALKEHGHRRKSNKICDWVSIAKNTLPYSFPQFPITESGSFSGSLAFGLSRPTFSFFHFSVFVWWNWRKNRRMAKWLHGWLTELWPRPYAFHLLVFSKSWAPHTGKRKKKEQKTVEGTYEDWWPIIYVPNSIGSDQVALFQMEGWKWS